MAATEKGAESQYTGQLRVYVQDVCISRVWKAEGRKSEKVGCAAVLQWPCGFAAFESGNGGEHSYRAAYGEKTLSQLSRALTKELGKGFSRSNVYNMRQFYLGYLIFQTVSGKLSWSHYCEVWITTSLRLSLIHISEPTRP